jgi:hypothetical protein
VFVRRGIVLLSVFLSSVCAAEEITIESLIDSHINMAQLKADSCITVVDKGAGLISRRQCENALSAVEQYCVQSIKKLNFDAPLTSSDAAGVENVLRACIPSVIHRYYIRKLEKDQKI